MAVLVERHQAGHGHRSQLKTQEEQQEVVGTYHHVHTQEGGEGEHVELALLEEGIGAAHPLAALDEHDECAEGEDALDDTDRGCGIVHAAKGNGRLYGSEIEQGVGKHEHTHQRTEPCTGSLEVGASLYIGYTGGSKEVCNEDDYQNSHKAYFGHHM